MKVSIKLGLASLSSLTLGLAILFLQSPTGSDAHAPLVVDSGGIIQSWGANSVNTNWAKWLVLAEREHQADSHRGRLWTSFRSQGIGLLPHER